LPNKDNLFSGKNPADAGFFFLIQNIVYFCTPILNNMAYHLSAKKRIRQTETRRGENRYYARTTRNAVKKLHSMTDKEALTAESPKVVSMIDKLAKKNIIHKNKAANLKSKLARHINSV
jgi:small subunit ribosomal protein S20